MGDRALQFLPSQIFAYNLNIIKFQYEYGPKHHPASSFINSRSFSIALRPWKTRVKHKMKMIN